MCFSVTGFANTVVVLIIYCPSTSPITEHIFLELSWYLKVVTLYKCDIVVTGDINIHVEHKTDKHAIRLQELLATFGCVQHGQHIPMQRDGCTLNLVTTKSEQIIDDLPYGSSAERHLRPQRSHVESSLPTSAADCDST